MRTLSRSTVALLLLATVPALALGQGLDWKPGLGIQGLGGEVHDQVVFDDGSGPALYAAGYFAAAGDVPVTSVARWNGSAWSNVGAGDPRQGFGTVDALAVFDAGSGPALYAGGSFTTIGGVQAIFLARWDGSQWSSVLAPGTLTFAVSDLAVFDDGNGPALYLSMGSTGPSGGVLRWDGAQLSSLPGAPTGLAFVNALGVFDDGSGPALYAGGNAAGGFAIKRWDGAQWTQVGAGLNSYIRGFCAHDEGTGPALYACGSFSAIGGTAMRGVARWDGQQWNDVGGGVVDGFSIGEVFSLASFDAGGGARLFAGGRFQSAGGVACADIAAWNGSAWSPLGSGVAGSVRALTVFDDGSGARLFAGGQFALAGGVASQGSARWDGASWSAVTNPVSPGGIYPGVTALAVHDDGTGATLYAGGPFVAAGGVPARYVARLDAAGWHALGSGPSSPVQALCSFDDGSGPKLFAGELGTTGVQRWDGATWTTAGSGTGGSVRALAVFDDGNGPKLYAGGDFTGAGAHVARWDGTSWTPLGSGVNSWVAALAVFDDGSGPALYAGGDFELAGGVQALMIAKWNGTSWSPVGGGVGYAGSSDYVYALQPYSDANGPALAVGGKLGLAGGIPVNGAARWNGASWSALGSPWILRSLAVFDDGTGSKLCAGASGPLPLRRWSGTQWEEVAGFSSATTTGEVLALCAFDDGTSGGPDLYVGGGFANVDGKVSLSIAEYRGLAGPGRLFCSGSGASAPCPCANTGAYGHGCANSAHAEGALLASVGTTNPDTVLLAAWDELPGALSIFLQGDAAIAPVAFGDGLRCVGGHLRRLYSKNASGGVVAAPLGAEPSITARSAQLGDTIAPGSTRVYQVYYRDPSAAFCSAPAGNTWNVSGALEIRW